MDASAIAAKLQERRRLVIELAPEADGKPALTVTARRPAMGEWDRFVQIAPDGSRRLVADWKLTAEYVDAWSGFSEGRILGSELAPDDAMVPFDRNLWTLLASDEMDWCKKIGDRIIDEIIAEHTRRKAASGN